MVKLVDTTDLKSVPFWSASSSLAEGTIFVIMIKNKFFLTLMIFLASLSALYALYIANTYGSMDFQYSPTKLFKDRINPYEYFLHGDHSKIIGVQYPVYSHATYIFFYIFSLLDWESSRFVWSITNIILGILCILIISKKAKLKNKNIILIGCIFCMSTPFRNCIGNGQLSFLVLMSYCSIFLENSFKRNLLLGVSYMKYSFMPVLAFFILLKDGFSALLISGLFCLVGWLIFSLYLDQSLLHTIFQPLTVGLKGFDAGLARGDLFTILNKYNYNLLNIKSSYWSIFFVIVVTFFLAKQVYLKQDNLLILNLLLIINLFTFGHLIYDYLILLPTFIYSFKNYNFIKAKISIAIVLYFWFGIRIYERIKMYILEVDIMIPTNYDIFINFGLLLILYLSNLNIKSNFFLKN